MSDEIVTRPMRGEQRQCPAGQHMAGPYWVAVPIIGDKPKAVVVVTEPEDGLPAGHVWVPGYVEQSAG